MQDIFHNGDRVKVLVAEDLSGDAIDNSREHVVYCEIDPNHVTSMQTCLIQLPDGDAYQGQVLWEVAKEHLVKVGE